MASQQNKLDVENAAESLNEKQTSHESKTNESTSLIKKEGHVHWKDTVSGIIASQLCSMSSSASSIAVQFLRRSVPDLQLNALRALLPLILISFYFCLKRKCPHIPRKAWPVLIFLLCTDYIETVAIYIGVSYIPLSLSQSVINCCRLVGGIFMFRIRLGEHVRIARVISVILCIFGMMLVLQPFNISGLTVNHSGNQSYISPSNLSSIDLNTTHMTPISSSSSEMNYLIIGCCFAAVCGIGETFSIASMSQLFQIISINDYISSVQFCQYTFHFVLSIVATFSFETPIIPKEGYQIFHITLHALSYAFLFPAYLYTANKLSGNTTSILIAMPLVYMTISQYTILKEIMPGHRNWMEVLGVFIVMVGTVFTAVFDLLRKPSTEANSK